MKQTESALEDSAMAHAAIELRNVEAALARLRNGTYGRCLDCGEDIPEQPLLLVPAASYCIACQAAHE